MVRLGYKQIKIMKENYQLEDWIGFKLLMSAVIPIYFKNGVDKKKNEMKPGRPWE